MPFTVVFPHSLGIFYNYFHPIKTCPFQGDQNIEWIGRPGALNQQLREALSSIGPLRNHKHNSTMI